MGRVINVLAALLVSAAVLALFAVGYGPVPALGRALVPGHGAWASAPGGQPIHAQTLSLPGLSSDKFELRLGLLRTAQAEWAATPRTSPAGQTLIAYSRGVNDYLAQARRTGDWPSLFGLTGVYPAPWTPTDSLVIQGVLTQELDYTTTPLDYAILQRTLGPRHPMAWFPIPPPVPPK